jgi:ABC-type arginine transport system permease subunit
MDVLSRKDFGAHLAIAAWMRIAYSGLFLLAGLSLGALIVGFGAATGDVVAFRSFGITGVVVGVPPVLQSLPGFVAGVGLLSRARWSRVMALVLSAFDLIVFPIGTILGAYTVFVLSQRAAAEAFGVCCETEEGRSLAAGA